MNPTFTAGISLQRLHSAADQLLSAQRPSGSELEIYATSEEERRLVFENDDLSVVSETAGDRYGLRLLHSERTGFATTNSSDPTRLTTTLQEAVTLADSALPSPFDALARPLPEHSQTPELYDLDAMSRSAMPGKGGFTANPDDELPPELPFEAMKHLLAEAKKDPRIAIDRIEFSISDSLSTITNSHGIRLAQKERLASWFIMGMARDGSEVTSFDYDGNAVSSSEELFTDITRRIADFRESVLGSLKPGKGKTYRGPILLHPYAVLDLLVGTVSFNAKSRSHLDGISPWVDRYSGSGTTSEKEPVAHPSLRLYEDPLDLSRPSGARFFDREGNLTSKHHILDDGRLVFLAENCHTAKRSGRPITGNATGNGRSLPDHGFSNLTLEVTDGIDAMPLDQLCRSMKSGLLLKRFSGNEDPISGRFSGVAKNSRWIENGEIAFGVQEVMVSGDLFGILREVIGASTERMIASGGWSAPYVLVDGCSVVFD